MARRDKRFWRMAQSTAEYVTLFAIIVGGLVAMQVYIRRSAQARLAEGMINATANLSSQLGVNIPSQFEPYYDQSYHSAETAQTQQSSVTGKGAYVGYTNYESNLVADANEVVGGNSTW